VPSQTVVATANVNRALDRRDARAALADVLQLEPDLVGLQEWNATRLPLLRETGSVGVVPDVRIRLGSVGTRRSSGYVWSAPLVGGCPVGARADRFDLLGTRVRLLSRFGRADRPDHPWGSEAPRLATIGIYRDKTVDRTVCLVNYHLVPGVQARGRYREDRPLVVARHRREVATLQRILDEQLDRGRVVYAVGDANFDGLRLRGLTSAWEGREADPGTLGPRRKIDDVHGPGPASSVTLLTNRSDHKAVIVRREDALP
jgi:hypothetical protein